MWNHDNLYIGGAYVAPASSQTIEVRSPATRERVGKAPLGCNADIDRAVQAARLAFDEGPWPRMSARERADALSRLQEQVMMRAEAFAQIITSEVGSPISFSRSAQATAPTMVLAYYAELLRSYPFREVRDGILGKVEIVQEALGVVAAIVPWNAPLFVTISKLAPALAAGCTVVVKPPPETPLYAYELAEALEACELPRGVVNIVPADRDVGEYLVRHPGINKVSFTGSTAGGRRVASICGERLIPCTLELGGKSAAILLDDVDLEETMNNLLPFAMMNSGQACIAQTRILVSKGRYGAAVDALTEEVRRQKTGDPFDEETFCGPLISERQRTRVEEYIASGRAEGARATTGGGRPRGLDGYFVEPTVFADVTSSMRIAREEIFGPVVAVIAYENDADAVRLANESTYGLSGSVWGKDLKRIHGIARQVQTGTLTLNGFVLDFAAPFGGYKESGLGRELGPEGLESFVQKKSIAFPMGEEVEP